MRRAGIAESTGNVFFAARGVYSDGITAVADIIHDKMPDYIANRVANTDDLLTPDRARPAIQTHQRERIYTNISHIAFMSAAIYSQAAIGALVPIVGLSYIGAGLVCAFLSSNPSHARNGLNAGAYEKKMLLVDCLHAVACCVIYGLATSVLGTFLGSVGAFIACSYMMSHGTEKALDSMDAFLNLESVQQLKLSISGIWQREGRGIEVRV